MIVVIALSGCVTGPRDVRTALLNSAAKEDPDFPDKTNLVLTHFSHVGTLKTSQGKAIYVADEHAVTAGALAPHGLKFIAFFDDEFQYLGKIAYGKSHPLWCEGTRLYLWGNLDKHYYNSELDLKLEKQPEGNVIDVADGFENIRVYRAKAYGSSGGTGD